MTEGRLDKVQVAIRIDIADKYKVLKRFGGEGTDMSKAFIEAIKFAVKGVKLGVEDESHITDDIREAVRKRLDNRKKIRAKPCSHTRIDYSKYS